MSTSIREIYDAFDAYFQANMPGLDLANTAFLGVQYVVEANTPYIALSMPGFAGRMLTIGQPGIYEHSGVFQVSCNWPNGRGKEEVSQQMDQVQGIFPNGLSITTASGLFIRLPRAAPRPLLLGNAWISGIIQARWFAHEFV